MAASLRATGLAGPPAAPLGHHHCVGRPVCASADCPTACPAPSGELPAPWQPYRRLASFSVNDRRLVHSAGWPGQRQLPGTASCPAAPIRCVEDGPTAIWVCALARRRLPGLHAMPGVRGGETVWREEMRPAWMAGVRLQILSAAVNQRNIAFPVAYQPVRHPTR